MYTLSLAIWKVARLEFIYLFLYLFTQEVKRVEQQLQSPLPALQFFNSLPDVWKGA